MRYKLTVAFITGRDTAQFWWFFSSLRRQSQRLGGLIRVVVVDYWAQPLPWHGWTEQHVQRRLVDTLSQGKDFYPVHVPPKPTVWQGPHRLTKNDYFAPSNARNTALCFADSDWIAYVDDLSALGPMWLGAAREAIEGNYIACGAFRKVKNLQVDDGVVKSFEDHPPGMDSRWSAGKDDGAVPCAPNWLFGCSCVMPVAALEKINGWPEAVCDSTGVGAEDCFTGEALQSTGHTLKYDRRLFTYEDEDLHFVGPVMKRSDKGDIGTPDSKSHAAVRMLRGCKRFDNDFTPHPDIAALRRHVLKGGDFPVPTAPQHDWYDGQSLAEL